MCDLISVCTTDLENRVPKMVPNIARCKIEKRIFMLGLTVKIR